jgi:hypothetical protein
MHRDPPEAPSILGYVEVDVPLELHESHEVAAWRTTHRISPGRYPVKESRMHGTHGSRGMIVEFQSVISDNYTPSLYGGVPIGGDCGQGRVGTSSSIRKSDGFYRYSDFRPFDHLSAQGGRFIPARDDLGGFGPAGKSRAIVEAPLVVASAAAEPASPPDGDTSALPTEEAITFLEGVSAVAGRSVDELIEDGYHLSVADYIANGKTPEQVGSVIAANARRFAAPTM